MRLLKKAKEMCRTILFFIALLVLFVVHKFASDEWNIHQLCREQLKNSSGGFIIEDNNYKDKSINIWGLNSNESY